MKRHLPLVGDRDSRGGKRKAAENETSDSPTVVSRRGKSQRDEENGNLDWSGTASVKSPTREQRRSPEGELEPPRCLPAPAGIY